MKLVYLSRKDVEALNMTMKDVLAAVDNGFRLKGLGKTEMPPKPGIFASSGKYLWRVLPANGIAISPWPQGNG